jgi:hypothetical protein
MERDAEIQQIRTELAILQDRYGLYGRMARILKGFFFIIIPVAAIIAVIFAAMIFQFDWLYGVFFLGAMLLLSLGAFWSIRSSQLRWIDVASLQQFGSLGHSFFFSPSRFILTGICHKPAATRS